MKASVFILALATALPAMAGLEPCAGGGASFAGSVVVEAFAPGTIEFEWTMWEDGSIRQYELLRQSSPAASPSSLDTHVATVKAGRDRAFRTYEFQDTAPPGRWVYRLEVRAIHGRSCYLETGELVVPASPSCDPAALCAQVGASFRGGVTSGFDAEEVSLQWLTHAESGAGSYRISRSSCGAPRDCSTEVATVHATGTCGQVVRHGVIDAPPAGNWTYVLDVLDSGGRTSCSLRLPVTAVPPSSR